MIDMKCAPVACDLSETSLSIAMENLPKGKYLLTVHPYARDAAWSIGYAVLGLERAQEMFSVEVCPALKEAAWCLWVDEEHAYYSLGA